MRRVFIRNAKANGKAIWIAAGPCGCPRNDELEAERMGFLRPRFAWQGLSFALGRTPASRGLPAADADAEDAVIQYRVRAARHPFPVPPPQETNVLISNAYAQAAAPAGFDIMQFLPIIMMFVVLYYLLIRPQQKKAKEHKALLEALSKGDEVVTNSGIAGRITRVGDEFVTVEIAENTEIRMQKGAVVVVLPKGSLKNL
jgi:preprotein translocase subunit YajC